MRNFKTNDRVALIVLDYPNQARLKILGRVKIIEPHDAEFPLLIPEAYKAKAERGILIRVEAFDWNCPQHITQRWTAEEVQKANQFLTT